MSKKIFFGRPLISKLVKGIRVLYDSVKVTLGPNGRNVIIDRKFDSPFVTKDGVTVAKEISVKDKFENLGVSLLKEVAVKTNDDAGDGTTTATVLAYSIIKEGLRYVSLGKDPLKLKNEIFYFLDIALKRILSKSKRIDNSIEDIEHVGSISSNNDPAVGSIITKAIRKIGVEGTITLEDGNLANDELNIVRGMSFDKGCMSHYFLNDKKKVVFDDCFILVFDGKIDNFRSLLPLLEKVSKKGNPLLIISDDINNDILTTLVLNNARNTIRVVAVKAPSFGDRQRMLLDDISVFVGCRVLGKGSELTLDCVELKDLGFAKRVEVSKIFTNIIKGSGSSNDVSDRIRYLKKELSNTTSNYDRGKLRDRISKLSGGIAVIKVGGMTDTEIKERKYRIEDALNATKAAIEGGVVPGGGVALLRTAEWMKNNVKRKKQGIGFRIFVNSMYSPFKRMLKNSGISYSVVFNKIKDKKFEYGYNIALGKYCNLFDSGVIDPTKVVRMALMNAVSISCLVLNSFCAIVDRDKSKNSPGFSDVN